MQRGFTLIELVVVLTIVAILAAISVPRFVNLQREARIGHLQGVRGSVVAAATLIHSAMLSRRGVADAAPCPAGAGATADNQLSGAGTACTEGGLVRTANGYPAASTRGIVSAAGLGTSFDPSVADLATDGYLVTFTGATMSIERIDASAPSTCGFTYTEPVAAATAPAFSSVVIDGC